MKILITGARGFIGRNLVETLGIRRRVEIMPFNSSGDPALLDGYAEKCDFLYHLAAVHQSDDPADFEKVNHRFFAELLGRLKAAGNSCPVLLPSPVYTGDDNDYNRSKLAAERTLLAHSRETGAKAIIYRLTNIFGRYARPYGYSIAATICYSVARSLPIEIRDPDRVLRLYYIDDVIDSFIAQLDDGIKPDQDGYYRLPREQEYEITAQDLADRFISYKKSLGQGEEPELRDLFSRRLYDTLLSYLP